MGNVVTVAVVGVVGVGIAMAAAGFGTTGIVAGSVAAGIQSTIGNVAAGSPFAAVQSFAAHSGFVGMIVTGLAGLVVKLFFF